MVSVLIVSVWFPTCQLGIVDFDVFLSQGFKDMYIRGECSAKISKGQLKV